MFTHYEDMKSDEKCKNWGGLGVRGHPRSWHMLSCQQETNTMLYVRWNYVSCWRLMQTDHMLAWAAVSATATFYSATCLVHAHIAMSSSIITHWAYACNTDSSPYILFASRQLNCKQPVYFTPIPAMRMVFKMSHLCYKQNLFMIELC